MIRRLFRLRRAEAGLMLTALITLLVVRVYLWRGRYNALRQRIDAIALQKPQFGEAPLHDLRAVAWSVSAMARIVPGASCLTQASAGQILLARRGYGSRVSVSVPSGGLSGNSFEAHAWLLSGNCIILGGNADEYARHRMLHDYVLGQPPGQI